VSATSITVPNPDLSAETALGREVGLFDRVAEDRSAGIEAFRW